jgi:hypothetical protein
MTSKNDDINGWNQETIHHLYRKFGTSEASTKTVAKPGIVCREWRRIPGATLSVLESERLTMISIAVSKQVY